MVGSSSSHQLSSIGEMLHEYKWSPANQILVTEDPTRDYVAASEDLTTCDVTLYLHVVMFLSCILYIAIFTHVSIGNSDIISPLPPSPLSLFFKK